MPAKLRRQPVSTDKRFRKIASLSDMGAAERWQHSGRALEPTDRAGVLAARATEEHIVDSLVLRGLLSDAQRQAALKLKQDYCRANLADRVTGTYNPALGHTDYFNGTRERNDIEEAAYRRWRSALRELGPALGKPVLDTACHDMWPVPGELGLLQMGLERLAKYYRLPMEAKA